jgi:hypothetical protein
MHRRARVHAWGTPGDLLPNQLLERRGQTSTALIPDQVADDVRRDVMNALQSNTRPPCSVDLGSARG